MVTGWTKSAKGELRYFGSNGVMAKGLAKVGSATYYFDPNTGIAAGGWVTISGNKYYFDKSSFKMVTGTKSIDGVTYTFSSTGIMTIHLQMTAVRQAIPILQMIRNRLSRPGSKRSRIILPGH